jgi:mannitol/fructose-specific phosphotransferase system IIA component
MVSTYVGEGFAIPHGTNESREHVSRTALGFLQFPDGIEWDEDADGPVFVCIPIAASGSEHLSLLATLAEVLLDPDLAKRLRETTDPHEVLQILAPGAVPAPTGPNPDNVRSGGDPA